MGTFPGVTGGRDRSGPSRLSYSHTLICSQLLTLPETYSHGGQAKVRGVGPGCGDSLGIRPFWVTLSVQAKEDGEISSDLPK